MKNSSTSPMTKSSRSPLSENQKSSNAGLSNQNFESLYLQKNYKGAAQYLLANKQQFDSGIFHYNLGTVYSKLGDQAAARYHLEKAIKEGYVNSASLNNLNFVKSQLQIDDLSTSVSLTDKVMNFSLNFPPQAYLSVTLIFVLLTMILIRTRKITSRMVISLALLLALVPIGYSTLYISRVNYAVALKEIPLYEGPSKIFNEKGKIRAGSKIILGEFKDGWFFVEYPLSLAGWVGKDQLGLY